VNAIAAKILNRHREDIAGLCRRHAVEQLEVFGSATRSGFDPDSSDFDFLVTFSPEPPEGLADAYLRLAQGLEQVLGRRVDLVTPGSMRNPYFRREVDSSRVPVYGARGQKAAV
jgi:uncharacterized protein